MVRFLVFEYSDERRRVKDVRITRKKMRDTQNVFELPDSTFISFYRLPKLLVQSLITDLEPCMRVARRNTSIPHHLQVLAFLSIVANGGYQKNVGHDFLLGLSQTSISRCIDFVGRAIDEILAPRYIKFSQNEHSMNEIKRTFYDKFGFPGIIGAIDCTHITIQKPSSDVEHAYYNGRKRAHTKNVEIICNYDLQILSINARYGGTAHDTYVWHNSQVKRYMERIFNNGNTHSWLIGDSGYEQRPWLMTPIRNTVSQAEEAYNVTHRKARNCVERCIGVLKNRFRILGRDRILRYSPQKSGTIINACAVLHNIMVINNVPDYLELVDESDDAQNQELNETTSASSIMLQRGIDARNILIQEYFN